MTPIVLLHPFQVDQILKNPERGRQMVRRYNKYIAEIDKIHAIVKDLPVMEADFIQANLDLRYPGNFGPYYPPQNVQASKVLLAKIHEISYTDLFKAEPVSDIEEAIKRLWEDKPDRMEQELANMKQARKDLKELQEEIRDGKTYVQINPPLLRGLWVIVTDYLVRWRHLCDELAKEVLNLLIDSDLELLTDYEAYLGS